MNQNRADLTEEDPLVTPKAGRRMANSRNYEDIEDNGMKLASSAGSEALTGDQAGPPRMTGRRLLTVLCILVTELCERLTYYSVGANMVLFCTSKLKFSSVDAATISLVFSGTVYIIPVLGGYIADAIAGKYNTIFGAALIYIVGCVLLPLSALDYNVLFHNGDISLEARKAFYILSLCLIAIGTGGIKANVGPFGAQQVRDLGEAAIQSFFNWFYWFINAGAMIAFIAVAYVQQEVSFAWGYFIPLASMMVALIIFMFGRSSYIHMEPSGSVLGTAVCVCYQGCCRSYQQLHDTPQEKQVFSGARSKNGGRYDDYTVEGVLSVMRVMPVFILIILYWAIYSQMQSTFFLQSETMDLTIGAGKVPAAALNVFNTIFVLILIPVVDRLIYPCFQKLGRPLTYLQRIGIGLILVTSSMVVGGIVEIYRKKELASSGGFQQDLNGEKFNSSYYSVFLQVPQFGLVGASEVFASVSGIEFAYTQAPENMKGLLMGLWYVASGLGNYVSTAIIKIVEAVTAEDPWIPNDINHGKMENLFFLLAILMAVNFVIFFVYAWFYKYLKVKQPEEFKTTDFTTESSSSSQQDSGEKRYINNEHLTHEKESTRL